MCTSIDSGTLAVKGDCIHYVSTCYESFILRVTDLCAIGVLYTDEFPAECVYYVFIKTDGLWHEVPGSAMGIDDGMTELGFMLCNAVSLTSHHVIPKNMNSKYGSYVVWPVEMAGVEMFDYYPYPRTIWERIVYWWYPREYGKKLSDQMKVFLETHGAHGEE